TERHGFARGTNSVSFFWGTGTQNILRRSARTETMAQDVEQGMYRVADLMSDPHVLHYCEGYKDGLPGAVLMSGLVAELVASQGFATKQSVREFLWKNSAISQEHLAKVGGPSWIYKSESKEAIRNLESGQPWPISLTPDNIVLVVAGGGHPTHALWM